MALHMHQYMITTNTQFMFGIAPSLASFLSTCFNFFPYICVSVYYFATLLEGVVINARL